jgi:glycosyltransferase involved in cell wall biosynthesis
MNIWLITIGEPIPHPKNKLRLHRTGILAKQISASKNHTVTWWTSTFNHFTKQHIYYKDSVVEVNSRLKMIALYGGGYKRNVSFSRIRDHKQIAEKFIKLAPHQNKPDIILASFPTLGLCEAAVEYGKKQNIPVIIDYRDMWPEVFVDILPKKIRLFGRIALFQLFSKTRNVFKKADGLIGITEEFLNLGLKKIERQKHKMDAVFPLAYLENQFNKNQLEEADKYWEQLGLLKDTKKICFFGTLGYQFDLETVIKASSLHEGDKYQFILCGTGDKLEDLKRMNGDNPNVIFPGYMSASKIKSLMNICDYGLCPYIPKEAFLSSMPGKAIEYFSSGLPILGTLGNGVLGKFLNSHKIGVNYNANNPESLLKGLKTLNTLDQEEMKLKILNLFNKQFNAKVVYANYLKHLEFVVSSF